VSYSALSMSRPPSALGQLGGPWGWYQLWLGPPLNKTAYDFSGWFYTDRGTAQLIARAAKTAGGMRYQIRFSPSAGNLFDFMWEEMIVSPLGIAWGAHVSWIYTDGVNSANIDNDLRGPVLSDFKPNVVLTSNRKLVT